MERGFKGVWIPKHIWISTELSLQEKSLYGVIISTCDDKGYYRGGQAELSKMLNLTKARISELLKRLRGLEYIVYVSNENIVGDLKSKNLKGKGYGEKVCEWCRVYTAILHEHHYPIPKSKGGTETVSICPNCHSEFHFEENVIRINMPINAIEKMIETRNYFIKGGE